MKTIMVCMAGLATLPLLAHAESPYFSLQDGDGFKRFSVSVGALHVMPQGKAQPFAVNTAVQDGETAKVGDISIAAVKGNLDPAMESNLSTGFINLIDGLGGKTLSGNLSGSAEIYGLESWNNAGTGLEADDVTTLGIMTNYFFTDNVSLEIKAGIPPKVDLQGKGKIYAPFSAIAKPLGGALGNLELENDIFITDLGAHGAAASARAWTPAAE